MEVQNSIRFYLTLSSQELRLGSGFIRVRETDCSRNSSEEPLLLVNEWAFRLGTCLFCLLTNPTEPKLETT